MRLRMFKVSLRDCLVTLDLDFVGAVAHRARVMPRLHLQKRVHVHAEGLLDPQRHFR